MPFFGDMLVPLEGSSSFLDVFLCLPAEKFMDGLHQKPRFDDDILGATWPGVWMVHALAARAPKKILWMVDGNILFQGN